jgi:mono/diheme cytochrome c family protein
MALEKTWLASDNIWLAGNKIRLTPNEVWLAAKNSWLALEKTWLAPQPTVAHFVLVAGILLCMSATSDAADSSQLKARGKVLLQDNCGRCHAIEAVGASPLRNAPPMRKIYARFSPRELQAELSEGIVSRHRDMPQIDFSDEDVNAILAYLYALAIRK